MKIAHRRSSTLRNGMHARRGFTTGHIACVLRVLCSAVPATDDRLLHPPLSALSPCVVPSPRPATAAVCPAQISREPRALVPPKSNRLGGEDGGERRLYMALVVGSHPFHPVPHRPGSSPYKTLPGRRDRLDDERALARPTVQYRTSCSDSHTSVLHRQCRPAVVFALGAAAARADLAYAAPAPAPAPAEDGPGLSPAMLTWPTGFHPAACREPHDASGQHPHRALPHRAHGLVVRGRDRRARLPAAHDGGLDPVRDEPSDAHRTARPDLALPLLRRHCPRGVWPRAPGPYQQPQLEPRLARSPEDRGRRAHRRLRRPRGGPSRDVGGHHADRRRRAEARGLLRGGVECRRGHDAAALAAPADVVLMLVAWRRTVSKGARETLEVRRPRRLAVISSLVRRRCAHHHGREGLGAKVQQRYLALFARHCPIRSIDSLICTRSAPCHLCSVIAAPSVFVVLVPVVTLQTWAADEEGTDAAEEGQAAKEAPREGFAFGTHVGRKGKEATRHDGPDAATEGGEGLGDAVEGAETRVRGRRVGDLRSVSNQSARRGDEHGGAWHRVASPTATVTYQEHDAGETADGANVLHHQHEAQLGVQPEAAAGNAKERLVVEVAHPGHENGAHGDAEQGETVGAEAADPRLEGFVEEGLEDDGGDAGEAEAQPDLVGVELAADRGGRGGKYRIQAVEGNVGELEHEVGGQEQEAPAVDEAAPGRGLVERLLGRPSEFGAGILAVRCAGRRRVVEKRLLLAAWPWRRPRAALATCTGRRTERVQEPAEPPRPPRLGTGGVTESLLEAEGDDDDAQGEQGGAEEVGSEVRVSAASAADEEAAEGGAGDAAEGVYDGQVGEGPALVGAIRHLAEDGGHAGGVAVEEAHGHVKDDDLPVAGAETEEAEAGRERRRAGDEDGLAADEVRGVPPEEVCGQLGEGEGGGDDADVEATPVGGDAGHRRDHLRQVGRDGIEGRLLREGEEGEQQELADGEGGWRWAVRARLVVVVGRRGRGQVGGGRRGRGHEAGPGLEARVERRLGGPCGKGLIAVRRRLELGHGRQGSSRIDGRGRRRAGGGGTRGRPSHSHARIEGSP
ncbi:hypothetical protein DCS_00060 [Drechmeria coniospora]|uniref:Uncharacterized protein n=1 Tax=Drechmeria coniospora TaxID=98403 RepID=A0A151GPB2_DRECN|nr:hypothetical protein DCS_00060 [Drechmeria coniospora]KYK58933.1 hypothetical protein DCS_00060 [Drechmeria coniospora]